MKLKLLIGLLFTLSGLTSLVYQSLWVRVLSLGVGSTSASLSIVLAIFFGGLALGSFFAGKLIHKIKRPVFFYGLIEGLVGVYSLGLIYLLIDYHKIMAFLPLTGDLSWLGNFLKFFLVGILIMPPTICMGASLPILVKIFTRSGQPSGRLVSLLYGINTFGAVLGAVIGSFALIPYLGLILSNHVAACINILIFCLGAFIEFRLPAAKALQAEKQVRVKIKNIPTKVKNYRLIILLMFFATGFSSIAAEVVWNKYLGIFFGTNIYGLGLILTTFLLGISIGSLVWSRFADRVRRKRELYFALFVLCAFSIFVTSSLLNYAPIAANVLSYYFHDYFSLLSIKVMVSGLILFPTTALLGVIFPLGINLLSKSASEVPAVVGKAYSINTLGSILGSCAAGFLLIPTLGSDMTIKLVFGFLLLCSLQLLLTTYKSKTRILVFGLGICLFGVLGARSKSIEFKNIIKSAYSQVNDLDMSLAELVKYFANDYEDFLMISEGKTAVISLSHDQQDGENFRDFYRLKTNGLNESVYNRKDLNQLPKYEALLGLLPYALHRHPERAFVVGYGGGFTVDFLTKRNLSEVYVAELEEGILEAADFVYKGENPITQRENLTLKIEDARFVMAAKLAGKFDIIVSQPSHSWLSGVANLFTKEYFEIVQANLNEKGIFSQWLNLYNMDEVALKSILKTFYTVFPHGMVFTDIDDQELIMIGSNYPVQFDYRKIAQMSLDNKLRQALVEVPFSSVEDFLSNYSMSRDTVVKLCEDAVINTDINAFAEVHQSQLFYQSKERKQTPQAFLSKHFDKDYFLSVGIRHKNKDLFLYRQLLALSRLKKLDKFNELLDAVHSQEIANNIADSQMAYLMLLAQRYSTSETILSKSIGPKKMNEQDWSYWAAIQVDTNKFEKIIDVARSGAMFSSKTTDCYIAHAALATNQIDEFGSYMSAMENDYAGYLAVCGEYANKVMGLYYMKQNKYPQAISFLEQYYRTFSNDVEIIAAMVHLYASVGQGAQAKEFAAYFVSVFDQNRQQVTRLSNLYREKSFIADADALLAISRGNLAKAE